MLKCFAVKHHGPQRRGINENTNGNADGNGYTDGADHDGCDDYDDYADYGDVDRHRGYDDELMMLAIMSRHEGA